MSDGIDRRTFIGASAAMLLAGSLATQADQPERGARADYGSRPAKNLIFMVSDGMSIGVLQLAQAVREAEGRSTAWVDLMNRRHGRTGAPLSRTCFAATDSANSDVTDSAAATSAWSTGRRVNNGVLCVTPGGEPLTPIFGRVRRTGRLTGLVSTTALTNATPAGWAVSHPDRHDEAPIAQQLVAADIRVMLGGGARHMDRALGRTRAMHGGELPVVRTREALASVVGNAGSAERLVGVFGRDHLAYEIDRAGTAEPSIAEMTRAALGRLDGGAREGFVLQIEGGRVDHAAHACDAAGVVRDQLAFDDAVAEAVRFIEGRDDTLLIVTTDHGNAAPSLTKYGKGRLAPLAGATMSFETLLPKVRELGWADARPAELRDLIAAAQAVELEPSEIELFQRAMGGEPVNAYNGLRDAHHVLGSLLANHTGVHFVSGDHTAEHVVVTATGPGAERIPGVGHLVDTHAAVVGALGL